MVGEYRMKIIETNLIGKEFSFDLLDTVLHEIGFNRGGMFDYDWAAYDYPLLTSKTENYIFLRIFTRATSGEIERSNCTVQVTDVMITGARYHEGLDFSKEIEKKYVNRSREILNEVAQRLKLSIIDVNVRDASVVDCEIRSGVRPVF
jgi:citrate lyase gamma subunit